MAEQRACPLAPCRLACLSPLPPIHTFCPTHADDDDSDADALTSEGEGESEWEEEEEEEADDNPWAEHGADLLAAALEGGSSDGESEADVW